MNGGYVTIQLGGPALSVKVVCEDGHLSLVCTECGWRDDLETLEQTPLTAVLAVLSIQHSVHDLPKPGSQR